MLMHVRPLKSGRFFVSLRLENVNAGDTEKSPANRIKKEQNMSKVYAEHVQKAQMLASGLRKNIEQVKGHGVTPEQLSQLEQKATVIARHSEELDELRKVVSEKASVASRELVELRADVQGLKQIVKRNFTQERWADFGILDKR